MRQRKAFLEISLLLATAVIGGGSFFADRAQAEDSTSTQLNAPRGVCGDEKVPQNKAKIPWVGCFYLSAGHASTGTFSNHQVQVARKITPPRARGRESAAACWRC
jgi:hypothetical protein